MHDPVHTSQHQSKSGLQGPIPLNFCYLLSRFCGSGSSGVFCWGVRINRYMYYKKNIKRAWHASHRVGAWARWHVGTSGRRRISKLARRAQGHVGRGARHVWEHWRVRALARRGVSGVGRRRGGHIACVRRGGDWAWAGPSNQHHCHINIATIQSVGWMNNFQFSMFNVHFDFHF